MDYPRTGFAGRVSGRLSGKVVEELSEAADCRVVSSPIWTAGSVGDVRDERDGSWETSTMVSALERGARLVSLEQWRVNLWR